MSQPSTEVLPAAQVAELIASFGKALRAFQMYLPNNPIYQRAAGNLRAAFRPIWETSDELSLRIAETEILWDEQVVYSQSSKSESLAWMLYKDGMRVLTLRRGVEEGEIGRFLELANKARFLPADAGDDLLTLLWEEEFESISYLFSEAFADAPAPERSDAPNPGPSGERQALVAEEAPPKPSGVVDIDDFDSTLYFLDESEVAYVLREVETEYQRDVRASALAVLFDQFELQSDPAIRAEILDVLDQLFPNLLNAGEFRAAAAVLRETRQLAERSAGLDDSLRERLAHFDATLSEPAIVRQLIQSLDESAAMSRDAQVGELLRELRPGALETILVWLPQVSSANVRALLEQTVDRMATTTTDEILRLLRRPDSEALPAIVDLCGRLQLQAAVPGLGEVLGHDDAAVRLAAVTALAEIGSPGALGHLDRAIEDPDRAVRLAAVRAAGARGYKNALRRVEAVVLGRGSALRALDITEKMAFFEAYATIAGNAALETLAGMLLPRGLLRRKEQPETRACAALALRRLGGPKAMAVLEQAADDRDPVVRNAVTRALRELRA